MSAKKVMVLTPSMKRLGGIQSYTKSLIGGLTTILGAAGVRVVAVPDEPETRPDRTAALSPVVKLRFLVRAFLTALHWRPDLIICTHLGTAPAARLIQKFSGVRYWLVLHGIEVWSDLPAAKQQALRGAQRYLVLTRFTLEAASKRHNLVNPAYSLLPPPFANVSHSPAAGAPSTQTDSGRPIVLTVGRLAVSERYKGHDMMLQAWPAVLQRVSDAVYWIVGDGDDRARLEARAQELGVADSVRFAGVLSGSDLNACYDACSVFAMPARTELDQAVPRGEGFGIVFLEAMSHGKPVVAPSDGAPAEFIRSAEHGLLVNPENSAEIAEALISLLEDPERARQMGQRSKAFVLREFSDEKFQRRLRQALQEGSLQEARGDD
jgi:glycosyltransferase involved in cell wall biosynthesis